LREPAALGKSFKASRSKEERPPAHHQLSHPAVAAALKSHFFDSIDPKATSAKHGNRKPGAQSWTACWNAPLTVDSLQVGN
jgi:hypothetical protein